jgi:hypothetical protein
MLDSEMSRAGRGRSVGLVSDDPGILETIRSYDLSAQEYAGPGHGCQFAGGDETFCEPSSGWR